jgi:hypothetical protein
MSKKKRRDPQGQTRHHRFPKFQGGDWSKENISYVSFESHCAYNTLFDCGQEHPKEVAKKLTDIWVRPDWVIIAVPRCQNCLHCQECALEAFNGKPVEIARTLL